ncbi:diguanylate cyclase (GGDEF) domain-containing protein [Ruminococcaceae bacterium YAD3003]|nr:diguanylate cyclase (GGDEF) domain-containing protein [Ruminococcaceae bacterium YAD3003]
MNRSTDLYVDGKRRILVADDEIVNREMLENILCDEYDVLLAEDGEKAYDLIRQNRNTLSLILLDLMMPKLNGLDLLSRLKEDSDLKGIPVIVLTSDQDSEVESLVRGAADFIPKPYPQPDVIRARISRSIELAEDRQIISATERDELTGLYSYEYFSRYVEQFDKYHPNSEMDALCLDVNHFHIVNERFGMAKGDEILRRIADCLMTVFSESDSVICRKNADTFLVYCSHRDDYSSITDKVSEVCSDMPTSVKLRIGVYAYCDKKLDIRARFDRAKIAADLIRNNYMVYVSTFDETLMENELFAEQLVDEFSKALAEKQFKVFFQPKFNIAGDKPVLSSAEALVRWFHPTLGMISPGKFIPLFEDDGLIAQLDEYIWRCAAETIADWKRRLGISVPVSVNLSRAEMYDPALVNTFEKITSDFGITSKDIYLEITESAYVRDSDQIVDRVKELRNHGFFIEMDDFGSGYSSLNMISELPIDALKLDMMFIRNAFDKQNDTRMISIVIDIADYLGVPVIAEGVETEEQYLALKKLGCTIIQGYYFSKPVPAEEFEKFLVEKDS